MAIYKTRLGELGGEADCSYHMDNGCSLEAEITTYGGAVRKLIYKGTAVVLGFDTLAD